MSAKIPGLTEASDSMKSAVSPASKLLRCFHFLVKAFMIALILVLVIAYIWFSPPVLTRFNPGFLLFPFPAGEEYAISTIDGITRDDVYFTNSAGSKLNGWFFQSPNQSAPVVLISHGNAGNISNRLLLAQQILRAGGSVFVYDYSEFGKSEGQKSLIGLIADSQAAFDYLTKTRKIAAPEIVVYGESIGGGPTCVLAQNNQVKAIILDSTFTSLLGVGKKRIGFFNVYPDFLQPYPAFNNSEILKNKKVPLLVIHGMQDEVIPFSEGQDNFKIAAEPKRMAILPNSSHNDKRADMEIYQSNVKEFLASLSHNK